VAYGSPPDDAEYGWQDMAVFDVRHIEHVLGQGIATPVPAAITITFTAPCAADFAPFTFHFSPSFPWLLAALARAFCFRPGRTFRDGNWHTWGLLVTATDIVTYLDAKLVWDTPNPDDSVYDLPLCSSTLTVLSEAVGPSI
jgi:hypothetical protein